MEHTEKQNRLTEDERTAGSGKGSTAPASVLQNKRYTVLDHKS